ncbi:hypothetical protein [Streptomyces sp. NPDC101115]|uniref:hypothetical protein n=1 Tax=Streptomyces sp. NPDC101115 TaxID=3366106 RepID=UPI0038010033
MFRIVTARRLHALQSDLDEMSADCDDHRRELADAKTTAELANDSAIRAETVAEKQLKQLAQAHADNIQIQRETDEQVAGLRAVIKQVTEERDEARRERDAARAELAGHRVDGPFWRTCAACGMSKLASMYPHGSNACGDCSAALAERTTGQDEENAR